MQLGTKEGHSSASGAPAKPRYSPFPLAMLPKPNPAVPQMDSHWHQHYPWLWPSAQDMPSVFSGAMQMSPSEGGDVSFVHSPISSPQIWAENRKE